MLIVKIMGGLGNQMFQYAFYRSLLERKRVVKVDLSYFENTSCHQGYELEKIFNIEPVYANADEIRLLGDVRITRFNGLRMKLLKKSTHIIPKTSEAIKYMPEIMDIDEAYFEGYWQSEKYFENIKDIIKSDFSFNLDQDVKNKEIINDINSCNSVSLHVRRGDYLGESPFIIKAWNTIKHLGSLGGVCTQEYYDGSIKLIKENQGDVKFFIFSDDLEWCKSKFSGLNANFVDNNRNENSYIDMYLMSCCKHNIIANSSFSWWGAWLNQNPEKIVIAPNKWFSMGLLGDIIPAGWIKI